MPEEEPPSPALPEPSIDELDRVRELLFGQEKTQLSRLEERLENPELRALDVGRVLPEAVRVCAADGDRLARALVPPVETALQESVRRRPSILTNAIFPIIGPAIRRASADAIARLVQSVNYVLDHSFSLRGLKWRFEAMRTGRSYAEIVLCRTLLCRVEQVFLVQRDSGLLLHHVSQPDVAPQNPEVVSGLLTAIHDFVRDSFSAHPEDGLHSLQVGGLTVWVESGPRAILAAVIRGHPPGEVRQTLQAALERIHSEIAAMSASADEPVTDLPETSPILSECLVARSAESGPTSLRPFWFASAVVLLLVGAWTFFVVRENRRWTSYVQRLSAEEGIVVSSTAKRDGRFHLVGWRDPLAIDPASMLETFGLASNRVVARWEPYRATTPSLVAQRARRVLRPPEGLELRFDDGTLRAEGVATKTWVDESRSLASSIPGVDAFDTERVFDPLEARLSRSVRAIEATMLFFGETVRLIPGQEAELRGLIEALKELGEAAREAGRSHRVLILGHTDRTGTAEYNTRLSQQRAEAMRALLETGGVAADSLTTQGVGTSRPLRSQASPTEEVRNRRVSFRVELAPPGRQPARP